MFSYRKIPYWSVLPYLCYAALGSVLYGYDGTYFTSVQSQDAFKRDFGTYDSAKGVYTLSATSLSLMTSLVYVGEIIGALTAPNVQARWGRRGAFLAAMVGTVIGVVIQIAATGQQGVIVAGRIALGYGIGMVSSSVPQYLSEIAPAKVRTGAIGLHQQGLANGQIFGALPGYLTRNMASSAAYRIPMALPLVIAILTFVFYPFVPESPRWLVFKGRHDDARRALEKIHKSGEVDVVRELEAIQYTAAREAAVESTGGWLDMLKSDVERRKIMIVMLITSGQQANGIQFCFSYMTVFLENIGIEKDNAYRFTMALCCAEVLGVFVSFFLVNRFPSRKLLLSTISMMTVTLLVCGILGLPAHPSDQANIGVIVCMMIFTALFNAGIGVLCWSTVASLTGVGEHRFRVAAIATVTFFVSAFLVALTAPYLFDTANLKAKIGFVYGTLCALSGVVIWWALPEFHGRSLEEIDYMLHARVPTREWPAFKIPASAMQDGALARSTSLDSAGDSLKDFKEKPTEVAVIHQDHV
ncbi:hypothetical protein PYCC9005_003741 [Savitreella phatthalungensis]